MYSETFHGRRTVAAEGASFNEVMLSDVFVLEVRAHSNLALEPPITYWAMIRQTLGMCCEMFGQVVLPKEPFLADAALVGFDTSVPHLMSTHVGAIRELHIANVTFEQLSVWTSVRVLRRRHIVVVWRTLRHVRS